MTEPAAHPRTDGAAGRGATLALGAALLVLVAAVYAPALDNDFINFDDRTFLVENGALHAGLSREGLRWAFHATLDANWIPLTWVSFLVDQEIHGLSARGTHATNLVLHALATLLLFLALARMTGAAGASAFVAAIFAVHPLHVESVAWAMERKDVLSGALFAAALLAWSGYASRPGAARYAAVLVLFALGLMAKPMLVTLPCVLLLLDAWPLRRLGSPAAVRRALFEKLPLLALSAVASAVTVHTQSGAGAVNTSSSLPWRLANAVVSYATYLRKAVAPVDLAVFYPHRGDALPPGTVLASLAVLAGVTALAALQWRRRPWIGVGWLWYLGMLVPVIGLLQVGHQAMADRYTYLPLVGATIPVAFAGRELARRGGAARAAVVALAAAAVLASGVVARRQLAHWHDDVALFEHALAVTERNARAHNGLASALLSTQRIEEARFHAERALALEPSLTDAWVNLGVVLMREGRFEEAIPKLREGLVYEPTRRAIVHGQIGAAELAAGRPEAALVQARQGLRLRKDVGLLHAVMGVAFVRQGKDREGLEALERAEALGVGDYGVHAAFGEALARLGRDREAADHYRRALDLRPESAAVANNLAWLLATTETGLRDPVEALALAERAAELAPDDPNVLDTLAVVLQGAGRLEDALAANARAAAAARRAGADAQAEAFEARAAAWRAAAGEAPAGP